MSKELKCPFCGEKLDTENYYAHCHNPHCNTTVEMEGTEEMWQALIQAKQDLEIAVDALKRIKEPTAWGSLYQEQELATEALEQIEHKDEQ